MAKCFSGFACGRLFRRFWTRRSLVPRGRAQEPEPKARPESESESPETPQSGPELQLEVLYVSGETAATIQAKSCWTGSELKRALWPYLEKGVAISGLIFEGTVIQDEETLEQLGVRSGPLHLLLQNCAYLVEGAGVKDVNGYYIKRRGALNSSPVYTNEAGVLLFKYRMARGTEYWYFSRDGDLSRSDGDFYRVRSKEPRPPVEGWTWEACPLGRKSDVPTLMYFGAADDSEPEETGCASSTASGEQSTSDASEAHA